VDGRSGSGKSTLAQQLAGVLRNSVVVHTDDVAWYESFFGWDRMLVDNVLRPVGAGRPVAYRPPAWDERSRPGAIVVPTGTEVLLVEGVGASRQSLSAHMDACIWVASDHVRARVRGIERDGGPASEPFWDLWQGQELPFLSHDRPWLRATAIVCGTPEQLGIPHDPDTEVLLAAAT
jgi:energy-coupling factor transporter ATP-binding protein EcfA2